MIDQTRHALVSVGAHLLGVVINDGPGGGVVTPTKTVQGTNEPDSLPPVSALRLAEGAAFERGLQTQRG